MRKKKRNALWEKSLCCKSEQFRVGGGGWGSTRTNIYLRRLTPVSQGALCMLAKSCETEIREMQQKDRVLWRLFSQPRSTKRSNIYPATLCIVLGWQEPGPEQGLHLTTDRLSLKKKQTIALSEMSRHSGHPVSPALPSIPCISTSTHTCLMHESQYQGPKELNTKKLNCLFLPHTENHQAVKTNQGQLCLQRWLSINYWIHKNTLQTNSHFSLFVERRQSSIPS